MDIEAIDKSVSLYDLDASLVIAMDALEAAETPEERQVCETALAQYMAAAKSKGNAIIAYRQTLRQRAWSAAQEIARLTALKQRCEWSANRIEEATQAAMEAHGITKIECNLGTLSIKSNPPAVEITDASLVPLEYQTAKISMPATLWAQICAYLEGRPAAVNYQELLTVIGSADEFVPRKAEIAKELKRERPCPHCEDGKIDVPGGSPFDCPECEGTGKVAGRVAGARLTRSTRLEIR